MHRLQVRSATEKELSLLLTHITDRADRARRTGTARPIVDELLVLLLVDAGLRPREVCTLRLTDVLARHGRTGLRVRGVRGAKVRTVEIPERVDKALVRFTRFHRIGARPSDPLLLSERGTPLSYMSLYSKVHRIGREAGIARLNPGALRFAFLRRLYRREQDLRYVQEQAGHAHLKTTAKYIRALTICESCGKPVAAGEGTHIDSGQLLCPDCTGDIRKPRP